MSRAERVIRFVEAYCVTPDGAHVGKPLKLAEFNPFTHAVEAMRFALVGQFTATAWAVVLGCSVVFFVAALWGYDPQRGWTRR